MEQDQLLPSSGVHKADSFSNVWIEIGGGVRGILWWIFYEKLLQFSDVHLDNKQEESHQERNPKAKAAVDKKFLGVAACWKLDLVECPAEVTAHDTHPGEHWQVAEVSKEAKEWAAHTTRSGVEHAEKVEMDKDGCNDVSHHYLAIHTRVLGIEEVNAQSNDQE